MKNSVAYIIGAIIGMVVTISIQMLIISPAVRNVASDIAMNISGGSGGAVAAELVKRALNKKNRKGDHSNE